MCLIYHSTTNGEPVTIFGTYLDALLAKQPIALVIITGDYNPSPTGLDVRNLLHRDHLKKMVDFKTRDTGTLDWFLSNKPDLFNLSQLPKIGFSDCYTILADPLNSNRTEKGR